jgi:DNA polymerase III delta prime subunit
MCQSVIESFWYIPVYCTFTGSELIQERLQLICSEEKVSCSEDAMKCLVKTSGGDLRRAITCLQSCSRLKGSGTEICADDVQEIAGVSVPILTKFQFTVYLFKSKIKDNRFPTHQFHSSSLEQIN